MVQSREANPLCNFHWWGFGGRGHYPWGPRDRTTSDMPRLAKKNA